MHWTVRLEGGPRRVNHAAAVVDDYIYSFGGYCTGDDYMYSSTIDVHILNTNNLRWSLVQPKKDENNEPLKYPHVPFQRYGHTVVAYKDKIYLWGGRNDDTSCNILYAFDTKTLTWSTPKVKGVIPGSRDGHSACVINDCMYIFGGFEEDLDQFSCDVHCLNFDTMEWKFIYTKDQPPSFRDFHSAAGMNNRMYIFGGRGDKHSPYHSQEEIYCPEIVYLDLTTKRWCRPSTTGKVPVGRRSHSMFTYNNLIYVFGGYNGILDQHFNDLYSFDPKTNRWNLLKPKGKVPSARRRQVCLVKDKRMYLFGGTSPMCFSSNSLVDNNDTHVLDFEPTLKTLAILAVIDNRIDFSFLPKEVRFEIRTMITPNSITRPINQAG
ncbi:kelch domain-containing protein 3 [Condylostylus longicornis]|uniref:kelch domain-containing protein 3 n=1 Tax=Condylostylus longicornis TaxID=2530218 RepID=UPI00244E46E3|nr:kelch domain-containing protein 3 [Condylostylus longicornis]